VFYGSNPYRKDNPRWVISNATETPQVPAAAQRLLVAAACGWDASLATRAPGVRGLAARVGDRFRSGCGICVAWLIGLPRRAGARIYAMNDAEAGWWTWHVTELRGGLGRQYLDARFEALRYDPTLRREELADSDPARASRRADCPCDGDT